MDKSFKTEEDALMFADNYSAPGMLYIYRLPNHYDFSKNPAPYYWVVRDTEMTMPLAELVYTFQDGRSVW